MDKQLDEYKIAVKTLAQAKSTHLFKNTSPIHACVVMANIFDFASSEVIVYDDALNDSIIKEDPMLMNSIRDFFNKGKKLTVVVKSIGDKTTDIYKCLKELHAKDKSRVIVKTSSKEFNDRMFALYGVDIHFTVGDPSAFRLEKIETSITRKAICGFNSTTYSKPLKEAFEKDINLCKDVFN
jgi:hypothetical protein